MPRKAAGCTAPEPETPPGAGLAADAVLTVEQAVGLSGLGRSRLWELMKSGELRWLKSGRLRVIPVRALAAWLGERARAVACGG